MGTMIGCNDGSVLVKLGKASYSSASPMSLFAVASSSRMITGEPLLPSGMSNPDMNSVLTFYNGKTPVS